MDMDNMTIQDIDEQIAYIQQFQQVASGTPPQVGPKMEDTEAFHTALKGVENSVRAGFDEEAGVWKPHKSLEGGTDTLGYGHKLTPREAKGNYVLIGGEKFDLDKGLSEEEVDMLFQQDVSKATRSLEDSVPNFDELPQKYKDILVNISFNVGKVSPRKWPKLLAAMEAGDDEGVRKEMVTSYKDGKSGKRQQLTKRASAIADAVLV